MATESLVRMIPRQAIEDGGMGRSIANLEDGLRKELELMLRGNRNGIISDRDRDLNIYRSGSAPPTVEGSMNAVESLFRVPVAADSTVDIGGNAGRILSDEALQSHPDYPSYYYSLGDLNPRLPPPMLSKEDWRFAQRLQAGAAASSAAAAYGRVGDGSKMDFVDNEGSRSLFSLQPPGIPLRKPEVDTLESRKPNAQRDLQKQPSAEWLERDTDCLIGLAGVGLGARRKSLADMLQEGLGQSVSVSGSLSHSMNLNAFDELEAGSGLHSKASGAGLIRVKSFGSSISNSFDTALVSSLSRSKTPDPLLIRRSSSPCLPPVGKKSVSNSNAFNGLPSSKTDPTNVASALSGLSLSNNGIANEQNGVQSYVRHDFSDQSNFLPDLPNGHAQSLQQQMLQESNTDSFSTTSIPGLTYRNLSKSNGAVSEVSGIRLDGQVNMPQRLSSFSNLFQSAPAMRFSPSEGSSFPYRPADFSNVDFGPINEEGYSVSQRLPSALTRQLGAGGLGGRSSHRNGSMAGLGGHLPSMNPVYAHFLQRTSDYVAQAAMNPSSPAGRNYSSSSHAEFIGIPKAYISAFLAQEKSHYHMPLSGKSSGLSHGCFSGPTFSHSMPYHVSTLNAAGAGMNIRQGERVFPYPSNIRSSKEEGMGSWQSENFANMEGYFASSLLDEFKSSKARAFELSDIIDHVVEFSVDQYGSRFIQQKLETTSVEEKQKVFPEIISHAHTLMTDVFGNYVIQKFFEHGTESQRKELAGQLSGHVLPLSIQMYGCRVIQKALEFVDAATQAQMVSELDGSVMKCVHDQNGNHVIQKCIECVPQERIQFVISSFYGQVVSLSTHPYGCRVIQRVLEHCNDPETQRIMMEEILQSVCTLAQDQYGNYVVQHVLQHGKPHERSAIINKLAGQIVKMSQQKFASNVVEKCLSFGGPEERQLLVNEMLGTTDENEPLQAMMKDQFANYVVQKVLETCDDRSRELILSRIKVHLSALKRYTYGKHIVARVEKLVTTGERRTCIS